MYRQLVDMIKKLDQIVVNIKVKTDMIERRIGNLEHKLNISFITEETETTDPTPTSYTEDPDGIYTR